MPPIMANSNEGKDHKEIFFYTSRKILSQEMTMCNMEALVHVSYFSEVMTNVNFFFKLVKCQDQKIKYLQKVLISHHKGYSCEISKL